MKFGVGKRIRVLRTEKGINLPELAEKAGVSKGFLSQLENDEEANPSLDSLNKFIKEMGLSKAETQPSLKVTRSGLPNETHVVVLDYQSS